MVDAVEAFFLSLALRSNDPLIFRFHVLSGGGEIQKFVRRLYYYLFLLRKIPSRILFLMYVIKNTLCHFSLHHPLILTLLNEAHIVNDHVPDPYVITNTTST